MKLSSKTRVDRFRNEWRVLYVWPYGGLSERRFPTWREAVDAAFDLEARREYGP